MAQIAGARNVDTQIDGNKLVITVDLSERGEVSRSGKSLVIGSTVGNKRIADANGGQVTVGLNVYRLHEA